MTADHKVQNREIRDVLRRALQSYPGLDEHVTIYILDRHPDTHRNDIQTILARTSDLTSNPRRISDIISSVESHLQDCLESYLYQ